MSIRVKTDSSGVDRLVAMLENAENGIEERLMKVAQKQAEIMASRAKSIVYGPKPFLERETGETANSIQPYTEQKESAVSFGVATNNLRTIYHELGTGPTGTKAGYPGEANVDQPIVRRSMPWYYWDEDKAKKELGYDPGEEREFQSMDDYYKYQQSGFVYTEGTRPKAFMHTAMTSVKAASDKAVRKEVQKLLNGE